MDQIETNQPKSKKWIWISCITFFVLAAALAVIFTTRQKSPAEPDPISKETSVLAFDSGGVTSDPFNDPNGPFYHKVYKASSSDGLSFTRGDLIADKASVPDLIKMPDGTLFFYAVDGASRSKSGVMVGRSTDSGDTWELGSMQLKNKSNGMAGADPQAILTDDGKIRLFYVVMPAKKPALDSSGKPIPDPNSEPTKIVTAVSENGINFTEEAGNRYSSTILITDPDVVKIGSKWFMYLSDGPNEIATSSNDGNTFTLEKTIRSNGSVSKTIAIENGKFRQFYCKDGISSATTTDGLNWSDDPGNRLSAKQGEVICDPTPVRIGSNWLMLFKSATLIEGSSR